MTTTVLVVDDSRMDRAKAGRLLEKGGFSVSYANNGSEALLSLASRAFAVVITDLQMPELDGLELVGAVRERFPMVPVILMTAHGSEEIAVRALQKGAASYVPKRSLATELVQTVNNVLELVQASHREQQVLDWMTRVECRFVLDNDVSAVPPLIGYLESKLTRLRLVDETALIQVGVALREALVNAMYHGNLEVSSELREGDGKAWVEQIAARRKEAPYAERRVRMAAIETPTEVTYVVTDEGPGFDPGKLPDAADLAMLEQVSGRGLLLIRTFMDEVHHNERGNQISMVKHLRPSSSD
ncbi:MAG: response regulator [Minicystis sp.]